MHNSAEAEWSAVTTQGKPLLQCQKIAQNIFSQ